MNPVDTPAKPKASPWATLLIGLTVRRLVTTLLVAVLVSVITNPLFITPFALVLGRVTMVAMVLLLAFVFAEQWQGKWMPRWLVQLLAVALAAPAATLLGYLVTVNGDLQTLMTSRQMTGFFMSSVIAITFGLLLALGGLFRERDAQLRAQALEFALTKEQLERQALDARLALLQAQIEPHFLLNTLANVQELVETGSPRAAPVFKSLIAYLRASMPQLNQSRASLGNEIALVRSYLDLMSMRMPDRLTVRFELDQTLMNLRFPPMALLTLVENAVRHGIDPSVDGGTIEVGVHRLPGAGGVEVWVADTGVGMAETARSGTGLSNLRQRLSGFFGSGAELELTELQPHGLRAAMRFHPLD